MTAVDHQKSKQPAFKESTVTMTTALSPNTKAVLFCLFQLAACMVLVMMLLGGPQDRKLDMEGADVKCNEHNQDVQSDYLRQVKSRPPPLLQLPPLKRKTISPSL